MNVRQIADYLQLNEKKVYALVGEGNIPATKVTGKWLFPRDLVDQWLLESSYGGVLTDRLSISGSDDPLVHRAVLALTRRINARALVSYNGAGTHLGLALLARRRTDICALNWGPEKESVYRHTALVRRFPQHSDWVIVRVCEREQGLMVRPGLQADLESLLHKPLRWIMQPEGTGSRRFLDEILAATRIEVATLESRSAGTALSERDAARRLAMNQGDIAPGACASAREYGLDFVSAGWEALDLAMHRGVYFRRLFRQLLDELASHASRTLADHLGGYRLEPLGRVIWANQER